MSARALYLARGGRIGRRSMMIRRNKYGAAALALGLAVSTLATPSFAQRSEDQMSGEREKALRECIGEAGKMNQSTLAVQQPHKPRSCRTRRAHGRNPPPYTPHGR